MNIRITIACLRWLIFQLTSSILIGSTVKAKGRKVNQSFHRRFFSCLFSWWSNQYWNNPQRILIGRCPLELMSKNSFINSPSCPRKEKSVQCFRLSLVINSAFTMIRFLDRMFKRQRFDLLKNEGFGISKANQKGEQMVASDASSLFLWWVAVLLKMKMFFCWYTMSP